MEDYQDTETDAPSIDRGSLGNYFLKAPSLYHVKKCLPFLPSATSLRDEKFCLEQVSIWCGLAPVIPAEAGI